jgi:SAM-dependent methyltransferase
LDARRIRATWDALAAADTDVYVGDPAGARRELDDLFARLGADPRGGVCVEVGCGPGRMTGALAERFDRVVAVDVSPAMVSRAREAVPAPNIDFRAVSGVELDGVESGRADVAVCYLVLQHLPRRRLVARYLRELARVLAPNGRAFVQVPVLRPGVRPRLWRALRTLAVPLLARSPERAPAFRGVRLTRKELDRAVAAAGLRTTATDRGPDAPYRHSEDLFLRLERTA